MGVTFPRLKMANLNPLELIEIVEKVTFYLSLKDLKRLSCVNSLWNQSCQKWINKRRQSYTSMRWINPSKQRHPWHSLSGNTTLFHHTQHGVLEQIKSWRKNRGITNDQPNLVILFTTGVV